MRKNSSKAVKLQPHEDFKAQFKEERKKDREYEYQIGRKFNCTDSLSKNFEEHIKQGNFIDDVIKKANADRITDRLNQQN